jgi:hypothetical protein
MRPRLGFLATVCLTSISAVHGFSCKQTVDGKDYDLGPLGGLREVSKESDTPPSKTIARVRMDLCSEDGVQKEDGVDEKDQVCRGFNAVVDSQVSNWYPNLHDAREQEGRHGRPCNVGRTALD